MQPFADAGGWWHSGDAGRLGPAGLEPLGRLDGALNSGGATVFPEQIEAALAGLPGAGRQCWWWAYPIRNGANGSLAWSNRHQAPMVMR